MNTPKKATFNEAFIYTVYNYHEQNIKATKVQYRYILKWQKLNEGLPVLVVLTAVYSGNLSAYGSMNLPNFSIPSPENMP